jgi:uncharacterized protein YbjT (DUF2867 family)
MTEVLVAGATGMLGRHICSQLQQRGDHVRALVRHPPPGLADIFVADLQSPDSLAGACTGITTVISCAGASMSLKRRNGRESFPDIDFVGNSNLLKEAKRAGVQKFVYVSLASAGNADRTVYVQAHERFVEMLRDSSIDYTVVRPTGFFGFYAEALAQAKRGTALVIGPGTAKTNPIHEADAARACIDAVASSRTEMVVGGPDVFTRRAVAELALVMAGSNKMPRHIPAWIFRAMLPLLRLADPRMHALFQFGIEVSLNDCIAPGYGRQRLGDYLLAVFRNPKTATA